MTELEIPCLVQNPIPRAPVVPLYNLLSGVPFLVTTATWSREEGENFSARADLKSAAMLDLEREEGRAHHVTGHRTMGETIPVLVRGVAHILFNPVQPMVQPIGSTCQTNEGTL